jgi:NDP-sugar pyrophosphorylase family protein/aminoglycoside/choline kinase family phosphotransferase
MKQAMILAAGFGTRLAPHSQTCPKPLFSIDNQPIIHRTIMRLIADGFMNILINIHHLATDLQNFIEQQNYAVPVRLCKEVEILGTGGGIGNMLKQVRSFPILIINSDIVTDLDFNFIFQTHMDHDAPVTLVMHDKPQFNTVCVKNNQVLAFREKHSHDDLKAFTGIHVVDSLLGDYLPVNTNYSIITAYEKMIQDGHSIRAHIVQNHYWADIGTPSGYAHSSSHFMAQTAFQKKGIDSVKNLKTIKLKGDGSDRCWWRYTAEGKTLIVVDHGISRMRVPGIVLENQDHESQSCKEVESFVKIGNHLFANNVPVPEIIHFDFFSGIVFLEDLGDTHLQNFVVSLDNDQIQSVYESVLDILIHMSVEASKGFTHHFTYQTASYDTDMILQYECRYFFESFVRDYMELDVDWSDLEKDFLNLVSAATQHMNWGFMHRDFQSRNIMKANEGFYIIDFQGARLGPVQYDLASLLIDPYVSLDRDLQKRLFDYFLKQYKRRVNVNVQKFEETFEYCRLFRNFQMLGAFAFLSQKKGKTFFQKFIPLALDQLKYHLTEWSLMPCPRIMDCVKRIQ